MRVILSGGPCSGKSTLISELARRGFKVQEEIARKILSKDKSRMQELEKNIAIEQARCEKFVDELTFFDRSLVDVIAYCKSNLSEYKKVFFLEQLPFEHDGLRVEKNCDEAKKMHEILRETYQELGFSLVHVPIMAVGKRADLIVSEIQKLKGGV